jgi:sterol desaturase/sphingolipid hydroxylase (fatty acid hydroxylase superfamily)
VIAPTPAMVGGYALVSLWNFFAHARLRVDLGRWSWLINTPAYHRRHHSRLPEHYDSNFAALFPVFDLLFGSYRRPDGWPPTGLDHAPRNARDLLNWPLVWDRPEGADEQPTLGERPI